MNRGRITSLVAGVITVNSIFVVGILTYLYSKDRVLFKWSFLSLTVMVVTVVLYSSVRAMLRETYKDPFKD